MLTILIAMVWLPVAAFTPAEELKLEIKQLHMCCDGCADEVQSVLMKIEGLSQVEVNRKSRTAKFSAPGAEVAQRAVDALAADGFHGSISDKSVRFKDDSGVTRGKVTSLTVTGFHNTCPGCVKSFRAALKKVPGVMGDDCKPNVTTCTIKGNFDATAVVEALQQEGFHAKVKN